MASFTAMKDPGFFFPFLVGLLLPLTLVSGQPPTPTSSMTTMMMNGTNTTTSPTFTSNASTSPTGANSWNTSAMMISCPSFICNYSDCSDMYNSQNVSMCTVPGDCYCQIIRMIDMSYNATCSASCGSPCMNDSQTDCTIDCCNSTGCLNDTFASMMSSTMMPTTTIGPTSWTMSMISCPSFLCNYSDCNAMYNSQNVSMCTVPGDCYCQIIRFMDVLGMCYNATCSESCGSPCMNDSQTDCSTACCNSTGCLNDTFASMISSTMISTTMMSTTTTVTTVPLPTTQPSSTATTRLTTATPTTTTPSTTATTNSNANKCHTGMCDTSNDCYKSFSAQPCATTDMHCELKKETVNSKVKWTAGCTTSCLSGTWCLTSTKPSSCHQECCNATTSSCLKLDGKLNVPNLAAGGPHFYIELISFLICLLCFGSLM